MAELDLIKQKLDVVSFISEYVPLKKAGRNFLGLCPFHPEKTPSFVVSPERQIWHCFGCQAGGDIVGFLMRIENLEFPEALKILAKRAGVQLKSFEPTEAGRIREKIYTLNHLAAEYYHYILTTHPVGAIARQYLSDRKITDGSIKLFKIGYAPDSWDSLIRFLTKKGYPPADLNLAGLVSRSDKGHFFDRFRGRVIFTLFDHRGNAVGFAGRVLDPEAKEAKYINTAETPAYIKGQVLYGLNVTREAIIKEKNAVVVEGEIDAIQSFQAGVKNVVAIKGSALTEGHVRLLKRYTENLILGLDADFAGDSAARRGIEMADNANLSIRVATVPAGKDPDECVRINPALWKEAVEKAVPFYDYVIDSAGKRFDPATADGKKKILSEVAPFLSSLENIVVREHYVKKLAQRLGVSEEVVGEQLEKEGKKQMLGVRATPAAEAVSPEPGSRREKLEEYLLSLILQADCPADQTVLLRGKLTAQHFKSAARGEIYQRLVCAPEKFSINSFCEDLPLELRGIVDRLYLYNLGGTLDNPATAASELSKTAWELKELELKEKLATVSLEIQQNSENEELSAEFDRISQELKKVLKDREIITQKV